MHGYGWRAVRSEADHGTDAPPRYFWVDELRVDLDVAAMRRAETAKQAVLFGNVKGRHLVLEKNTHILSMLWYVYIISLGSI